MKKIMFVVIALISFASAYGQSYNLPIKNFYKEATVMINDTNLIKCKNLTILLNKTASFYNPKTMFREEHSLDKFKFITVKEKNYSITGGVIGGLAGFVFSQGLNNGNKISIVTLIICPVVGYAVGATITGLLTGSRTYYVNGVK